MKETSATDGYYTQYILSTYLLVPNSVIDLFSSHCAKICVFNREKKIHSVIYMQICLGKPKLVCQKPTPNQKKHSEQPDLASKLAQLGIGGCIR